jgi:hypothetical protein
MAFADPPVLIEGAARDDGRNRFVGQEVRSMSKFDRSAVGEVALDVKLPAGFLLRFFSSELLHLSSFVSHPPSPRLRDVI